MLSIVVSIHNQIAINKLFYESLTRFTKNKFELIIIDNGSFDGSTEYFESKKEVVLCRNESNFNYPYCQNQGLRKAKYNLICFLNNDIIVSPHWDEKVIEFCRMHPHIEIFSVSSNDHLESKSKQKKVNRRWKRIKYTVKFLFGINYNSLKWMHHFMYGNWIKHCDSIFAKWKFTHIEGYSGSVIITKKEVFEKIGLWDERIQAADFDIFNRVKKRSLQKQDIFPIQLILGIYFHHFQRMTAKTNFPPFQNKKKMISLKDKWGDETKKLRKDIVG